MHEDAPETMAARIVAMLRDDIVKLALRPGDIISESDIAAKQGVSRQPVREAFIRLSQQGLLLIRPKRATTVKKISVEAVLQSRFIREAIEVEILRRVAGAAHPNAKTILDEIIGAQKLASDEGDTRRFHELDEDFHRQLARLAGVEYAWQLVVDHKIQLDRVRYLTLGRASAKVVIGDHEKIVSDITRGDVAGAERAIRVHLGRAETFMNQTISDFPDYFDTSGFGADKGAEMA